MLKKNNRLSAALVRNKYSVLAFGVAAFIMVIVYYCFEVIPFGDMTVLRMDMYHQYGPLFAELYDRITQGKSLLYSWNTGLGSPFIGNFSNYLASPTAVFMLLLGHQNMPEAISLMILVKAAFSAAFFSYYLRKVTGKDDFSITAFGVLYAFCGYFIAYYWNIMWTDAFTVFPLVMYGLECLVYHGKWRTYLFSLAFVMVSNYYMAYIICLFSVLYFAMCYLSRYNLTTKFTKKHYVDEEGNELKVRKKSDPEFRGPIRRFKNSRFLVTGCRFALASVGAAALAAFLLVPTYFILKSSSATSGTFPSEVKTYFNILDFLANHFTSLEPTIRSSGEDVLPNIFCGAITVMLVPLYLYSKHYTVWEKTGYVAMLGVLFISFNTNMLNYVWHGFHFPNDLPYRFSFVYCFILLVMAYKALIHIKDYSPRMLLTVGIITLSFIIMIQKVKSKNVTEDTVIITIAFIAFYTFLLILMRGGKYQQGAIALLLLCGVISEMAIGNTSHYVMHQAKKYYADDYQEFCDFKATLDAREPNDHYRMELTDLRARMDPSWYDYNGLSVFSSMAYETTSNLVHYLGVDGNVINSYTNNGYQTPVFNMMTSMKYIVDNTTTTPVQDEKLFTYVGESSEGKFKAYENNYCLNVGYCVKSDVLDWSYDYPNPFTVQNDYFEKATGIDELFTQREVDSFEYNGVDEIPLHSLTGEINYTRSGTDGTSLTAIYNISESKNYYLYINCNDFENVNVIYDDVSYNHDFDSEQLVGIGFIEAGTTLAIELPFESDAPTSGSFDLLLYSMDMEKFERGYNQLKSGELNVTTFTDTTIEGTVNAAEDCLFYTSIPYDEGWQVTVDGKRVSVETLRDCEIGNGFLGFSLDQGEHTIKLKYVPRGLLIGCGVSAATALLLFVLLFVLRKKKFVAQHVDGYSDQTNHIYEQYVIPQEEPEAQAEQSETESTEPTPDDAEATEPMSDEAEQEPAAETEPEEMNPVETDAEETDLSESDDNQQI